MKKTGIITLMLMVLSMTSTFCQEVERPRDRQGGGDRGPSHEYLAMIDSLSLDADQKQQFEAMETMFRSKRREEMKAARENGEDRSVIREKMGKMQEEQMAALKNLFTEEQFNIYSDFIKKQQEARKGGGKRRRQG